MPQASEPLHRKRLFYLAYLAPTWSACLAKAVRASTNFGEKNNTLLVRLLLLPKITWPKITPLSPGGAEQTPEAPSLPLVDGYCQLVTDRVNVAGRATS